MLVYGDITVDTIVVQMSYRVLGGSDDVFLMQPGMFPGDGCQSTGNTEGITTSNPLTGATNASKKRGRNDGRR
jgi:hypothetical protein